MGKEAFVLPDYTRYKIKKDIFRQERGDTSQLLDICCSACLTHQFIYQKDGPGELFRCYLDRIAWPPELAALQELTDLNEVPSLNCNNCIQLIAVPMIYEQENRLAYRMIPDAFIKTRYKLSNFKKVTV